MEFYEKFISVCSSKGVAPSAIAAKAGFDKSIVSYWKKHSEAAPKLETLQKIALALGVPVSELMGDQFTINIPMPDYPMRMPTAEELDKLSPAEQKYIELRLLADTAPDILKKRLLDSYDKLNKLGQVEAVRRTQEIAELTQYTEPDRNNNGLNVKIEYTTPNEPDTSK